MTTGTQTLTMEQIQGWWLPARLHKSHKRIHSTIGELTFGLIGGLATKLDDELGGGLRKGLAGLHHLVARVVAARSGLLPIRLTPFLDDLTRTGVMYRAGAGYRFRHRTLSRWLADEWNQQYKLHNRRHPANRP